MRSRHSVEEKFEMVMEALTENTTQAEICRKHGIFPTQPAKWKEQFMKSGKKGLSDGRHPQSRDEEIDDLKRMIGEQTLVINAFKKGFNEGQDDSS
jgi:transposase-like protein